VAGHGLHARVAVSAELSCTVVIGARRIDG
jgi:hypothetical protein